MLNIFSSCNLFSNSFIFEVENVIFKTIQIEEGNISEKSIEDISFKFPIFFITLQ